MKLRPISEIPSGNNKPTAIPVKPTASVASTPPEGAIPGYNAPGYSAKGEALKNIEAKLIEQRVK